MANARRFNFSLDPIGMTQTKQLSLIRSVSKRPAWYLALLSALVLAICLPFLQALLFTTRGSLPENTKQNTIRPFAVYMPAVSEGEQTGLQPHGIDSIRTSLNNALLEQQVQIVDAYAGFSAQTLTFGSNSLSVSLSGVSGANFATFRHAEVLSGNFLTADAFNRRRIVLDELAAWQLFGAIDVTGFSIQVQDMTLTVSGVIHLPDNWQSRISRQDKPQAFVLYETLNELDSRSKITSYEVRLPEPVQGMALTFLQDALSASGINREEVELVDQDARLGLWPLLTSWRTVGKRVVRDSAIFLPWWENAARAAIDLASMLSLVTVGLLILLTACLASLKDLTRPSRNRLFSGLFLASLVGLGIAFFLTETQGEWVPSGGPFLGVILFTLALPQLICLLAIHWSMLRQRIPNTRNLHPYGRLLAEIFYRFINQLRNRRSAKEETSR